MSLNGSEYQLNHHFGVMNLLWSIHKGKDKNLPKLNYQIYISQKNKPFILFSKNYKLLLMKNQLNKITSKVNFGVLLQLKTEIKEMKLFMIILVLINKKSSNKSKNTLVKRDKIFMSKLKHKPNTNKKLILLSLVNKLHLSLQALVRINKRILEWMSKKINKMKVSNMIWFQETLIGTSVRKDW